MEEAANHACKVKKKRARTVPHFHSSGGKTLGCSDRLVKTAPGMLGNVVWSRRLILLWVLQDKDNFDLWTTAFPGGS